MMPDLPGWLLWGVGGTLSVAGVFVLWWAVWGDRAKGRRRCPKCWYDMSRTDGLRCPECGREARFERLLHKGRARWRIALIALLALILMPSWIGGDRAYKAGWFDFLLPEWLVMQSFRINKYEIQEVKRRSPSVKGHSLGLRILFDNVECYLIDSPLVSCYYGQYDITGDSINDLVLVDRGRAEPRHIVITLPGTSNSSPVQVLGTIDGYAQMVDLDRDGVIEFRVLSTETDWAIARVAPDRIPEVILQWSGSGYEPAMQLMQANAITYKEFDTRLLDNDFSTRWDQYASALSGAVLDSLLSGNEARAWQLIDEYWPDWSTASMTKEQFKQGVHARIHENEWLRAVVEGHRSEDVNEPSAAEPE